MAEAIPDFAAEKPLVYFAPSVETSSVSNRSQRDVTEADLALAEAELDHEEERARTVWHGKGADGDLYSIKRSPSGYEVFRHLGVEHVGFFENLRAAKNAIS